MFSKDVLMTDDFLDLPPTTKVLYFFLNLEADDDGFVGNPRTVMRFIGSTKDDMKLLVEGNYVLLFDTGVVVVTDWTEHNSIRRDRKKATRFVEEMQQIALVEGNKYKWLSDVQPSDNQTSTKRQPNGCIGEDSIEEDSIEEGRVVEVVESKKKSTATVNNPNDLSDLLNPEPYDQVESNHQPLVDQSNFNFVDYYENKIGMLDGSQFQRIKSYMVNDGMEPELIKIAIDKAADNSKRYFGYINAILKSWAQNGIKTVAQQEEEQRNFESRKSGDNKPVKAKFGPACSKY